MRALPAAVGKEAMAHHFSLLLEAIAIEWTPFDRLVGIAAERGAHQHQGDGAPYLSLPDMGHFVDEQALQRQSLGREIFRPELALRMEVDVAGRSHDD